MSSQNKIAKSNKSQTNKKSKNKPRKSTEMQHRAEMQAELAGIAKKSFNTGIAIVISTSVIFFLGLVSVSGLMPILTFFAMFILLYCFVVAPLGIVTSVITGAMIKRLRQNYGEIPHDKEWKRYVVGKILCLLPAMIMACALIFLVCLVTL